MGDVRTNFQDDSTECAICLYPLDEEEKITLTCGHRWHLRCVRDQLSHAVPQEGKRLLFSGCRCAKCGVFCDHPALEDAVRDTARLKDAVDELIEEQAAADLLHEHREVLDPASRYYRDVLAYGRHKYAFYMCSVCTNPYFGGTVECADPEDGLLPPAQRVCDRCNPAAGGVCSNSDHAAYYVWKCRYCCRVASHVCYGGTHFCDSCHDRESERVRRGGGAPLDPIPCIGDACNLTRREGQLFHSNGPSRDCEQLLGCLACESNPDGLEKEENVSQNFVFNTDGSRGLLGWTTIGHQWDVEESEIQYRYNTHNFVCSFCWAVMAQAVDLQRVLARPGVARLRVSARYLARHDCPAHFRLRAALYNESGGELMYRETEILDAPQDFWERAYLTFEPDPAAACVVVGVDGKDTRFWAGNFGAKCTDISVEVLFDGSHGTAEEILRSEEIQPEPPSSGNAMRAIQAFQRRLLGTPVRRRPPTLSSWFIW